MASTDLFLFFKKLFMKQKQVVGILVSISFGSSQLEHTIKANCMKLQTVDPEIWTILIFDPGTNFSTTFRAWFFKKNISQVIFYWLAKFHCLIVFTSWDIWQCVYCDCYSVCDFYKFWNLLSFLIITKRIPTWPKSQNKNLNFSRAKRAFKVKWKVFFVILKGLSVAKNCLRPENAPLKMLRCSHRKFFKDCLVIIQHSAWEGFKRLFCCLYAIKIPLGDKNFREVY